MKNEEKLSLNYHQISSNTDLISSAGLLCVLREHLSFHHCDSEDFCSICV